MSTKNVFNLNKKTLGGLSKPNSVRSPSNPFESKVDGGNGDSAGQSGINKISTDIKLINNTKNVFGRPNHAAIPSNKGSASVFGADDDDDGDDDSHSSSKEDNFSHIARVNAQLQEAAKKQRVDLQQVKAIMEDETVYEYDSVLESLQSQRTSAEQEAESRRKQEKETGSKYLDVLKEAAELRKRERQLLLEKQRLHTLKSEESVFGEKEKFVTSAYKKKLEEDRIWNEKLRAQDERDEAGMRMGVDKIRYKAMLGAAGLDDQMKASGDDARVGKKEESANREGSSSDQAGQASEVAQSDPPSSKTVAGASFVGPTMPHEAVGNKNSLINSSPDDNKQAATGQEEGQTVQPEQDSRAARIEAAKLRYFERHKLREEKRLQQKTNK